MAELISISLAGGVFWGVFRHFWRVFGGFSKFQIDSNLKLSKKTLVLEIIMNNFHVHANHDSVKGINYK